MQLRWLHPRPRVRTQPRPTHQPSLHQTPINPATAITSARHLRAGIVTATRADIAVIIADSDGRADRRGATVISLGAAGIAPLRITEHTEPTGKTTHQEDTLTDMITAAASIVLPAEELGGQRGVRTAHYRVVDRVLDVPDRPGRAGEFDDRRGLRGFPRCGCG
ncbi:MAG: coenzyme F420-0:L-glutamate ligase [Pseudonocardiaceae bacterium]